MAWIDSEARIGLRYGMLGLAALAAVLFITSEAADARHSRHSRVHISRHAPRHNHRAVAQHYAPASASIVADGNSGAILQASNADAARHPASLTKIMTLYLLFERLEAGKIRLDTPLKVSEHAAAQAPTKLNLKPGQTIAVEDAIKGVVTRSANDVAVVIAENIGGSEEEFATLMTQKAHALGMGRTTYVNASGLPDEEQITTAHDQMLLGRAIQERYPRYYKYFSTRTFEFRGQAIRNHNHLLGSVNGVDGIKTGFTRASGFNLVTSVHRDGRYIVAVVLGGRSAFERDAHMRQLIDTHIKQAALQRTSPMIAEKPAGATKPVIAEKPAAAAKPVIAEKPAAAAKPVIAEKPAAAAKPVIAAKPAAPAKALIAEKKQEQREQPQPVASAKTAIASHTDATPIAAVSARAVISSNDQIQPIVVKTISFRPAPVQTAALGPMPALAPVAAAAPQPETATAVVRAQEPAEPAEMPRNETARKVTVAAAETAAPVQAPIAAAAKVEPKPMPAAVRTVAKVEPPKSEPTLAASTSSQPAPQAHAHSGWLIQIGAFDGETEARQHLSEAQIKERSMLAAADPFTERVQKGEKALYRARFAGFDKDTATAACKQLKRSDIECLALKN